MTISVASGQTSRYYSSEGSTEVSSEVSDPSDLDVPFGVVTHVGPAGLTSYLWDFSRIADTDFDRWPDDWSRRTGLGYPEYVAIGISPRDKEWQSQILTFDSETTQLWSWVRASMPNQIRSWMPALLPSLADGVVNQTLRIELDGGLAQVTSPSLPTSSTYQYRFSVDVRTDQLVHDFVYASVLFADEEGRVLQTQSTPRVTKTQDWQRLSIDALIPPSGARSMQVRLHVDGGEDGLEDIRGTIEFDNVRFRQFPQLVVSTDRPLGVYEVGMQVTAKTELLGLPSDNASLRLRLTNSAGQLMDSATRTTRIAETTSNSLSRDRDAASHQFEWQLDELGTGYYELSARMESQRGASLDSRTSFVVVDPSLDSGTSTRTAEVEPEPTLKSLRSIASSDDLSAIPFGWVLPDELMQRIRSGELSGRGVAAWLQSVGVGWIKMPVWYEPDDDVAADAASVFATRLRERGIEVVGMLDQPPVERRELYQLRDRNEPHISDTMRNESLWYPELESIMNRMTLRIRRWQLGSDDDVSFTGRSNLAETINDIAESLQGFGQPIEVAITWPWLEPIPNVSGEAWKAILRRSSQPLTPDELDEMLESSPLADSDRETWITLNPLPSSRYDRESRIIDLILRMAVARHHRVTSAMASNPMDPFGDLLTPDGRPGQLLLPWRTASLVLGHSQASGSLRLQNRSYNTLFVSPKQAVLMIWADQPTTETLFLGDDVTEVDVWGNRRPLSVQNVDGRSAHVVNVTRMPKFLVGVDASLAEFRMSVDFDAQRIDSILGAAQTIGVQFANPIDQSVNGAVRMVPPTSWRVSPVEQTWELMARRPGRARFDVVLSNNATIGTYDIPIDFRFETVPPTRIRVHRPLAVGPAGFDLVITTRVVQDRGIVKIELANRTARAARFDCLIFAGGDRQYERRTMSVPAGDTIERSVDFENVKPLIGRRMLLRAVEQNGNRVINQTFELRP
ncbi:MAG: hypothetical protein AAGC97_07695 [Planctomycetota bacterium]